MLKRNPDAPIFCEGSDEAPAGVCTHCGSGVAADAEYCGLECRLKASEAAVSKRIAGLEAKVEELLLKEQMREGAERAEEESRWSAEEESAARIRRFQASFEAEVLRDQQWLEERYRRRSTSLSGALRPHSYVIGRALDLDEILANCIPSRASMFTGRESASHCGSVPAAQPIQGLGDGPLSHIMPMPAPRQSTENAPKSADHSPLTSCVDWVNATVARFSALGGD